MLFSLSVFLLLFFFQPFTIYFYFLIVSFLFSSNLSVFLSLFSLTIYYSPICSSGNTDENTSEELACRYIIWLTPLNLPLTLILFPVSHTVTWQSAQQRCDCWSNSSRSNTKRLLIFIKSSSSHWSFFCKSIIREQCVENVFFSFREKALVSTVWGVHCVSFARTFVSQRYFELCFAFSNVCN